MPEMLPRKRPFVRRHRQQAPPQPPAPPRMKPGVDHRLRSVLARIGTPEATPFRPDRFQLEALAAVAEGDCLVTAPTGAGKTWIALEAIARMRAAGLGAWYACPLKALSNAKFVEFSQRFGGDQVGILTGDRRENGDAPIIVGTTEILRNQLYDAMHRGQTLATDFVVLDEAHFLGDTERGVVWEEIMIYLPARIALLMLSATIGNARHLADWLEAIRGRPCRVVSETQRPVPLFPLLLPPSGTLLPLVDPASQKSPTQRGRIDRKALPFLDSGRLGRSPNSRRLPPFGAILRVLRSHRLLPAIFFLKSRADCDLALSLCSENAVASAGRAQRLGERVALLSASAPRLAHHRQRDALERLAVGSHHAGQLPAWKLLLETLMKEGLLDAIFATSTVAAGVNFPARSIVLLNSDRFNGVEFLPLTPTEFHQMTGRAGRRGMDRIGFAVLLPGPWMDMRHMARLLHATPSDVHSQIRVNFSMILNLLLSHRPAEVEELLSRSLAAFSRRHSAGKPSRQPVSPGVQHTQSDELVREFRHHLAFLQLYEYATPEGLLTEDGLWASRLRVDQPLLIAEALRQGLLPETDPPLLAGIIAAFVNDRDLGERFDRRQAPKILLSGFMRLRRALRPFAQHLFAEGFGVRPLFFRPALALYAWTGGEQWETVCKLAEMDEGSLASLILRTADHLRHIVALAETFPQAASTAAAAIRGMLREPVL